MGMNDEQATLSMAVLAWPDADDHSRPLGFMPDQFRQNEERQKALQQFHSNHGTLGDLMSRWLLKDHPH